MLKHIFSIAFLAFALASSAQKFGYVDSKYILGHMEEYQAAQQEINKLSSDWQKEIEAKYETVDKLEKGYQAEKILLTNEMRTKREEEIVAKRQEAKDMQKTKFGVDGDLFKKREELVKPLQDQIYEAIKDVSSQNGLMVVFDKANHSNMLYTNPKHDISDKVLKKMGLTPGETLEEEGEGEEKEGEGEKDDTRTPDKGTPPGKGSTPPKGGERPSGGERPGGGKQ
ncbi:MAG: OmpH family outer membrane protein [Flavobacteriales bacterium]|nr:OmpH family outer membrane protein [Flavobacteriales bacterium]